MDRGLHAQGYFVYDSRKAGAVTVSHLRFGKHPIRASYLIGDGDAHFVACHQPLFLERFDMLDKAGNNSVFLLNSPAPPDRVWDTLPRSMQRQMIDKKIRFYSIDAYRIAEQTQMGKRINTIMQTCFFAISGVLPRDRAIQAIKDAVAQSYGTKGQRIVDFNFRAIDAALASGKPSLIACRTTIAFGAPTKAGTSGSHGSPLGDEEIAATRKALSLLRRAEAES